MNKKLTLGYFYKDQLNLYGDNGNVEILVRRCRARDIPVDVIIVDSETEMSSQEVTNINLVFMGGGPDSEQKTMYQDLLTNKKTFFEDYIESGGVGLFICGSYQLMGRYYKTADGNTLEGLGIFNMYTEHFGLKKPRCIGNTKATINDRLVADPFFANNNIIGSTLVGFENHGGRTYLGERVSSLASISVGHGNNSEDGTEGIHYKNSLGTYFHGPFLSKNPHIADFIIAKALGIDKLSPLNDSLIIQAHAAALDLRQ